MSDQPSFFMYVVRNTAGQWFRKEDRWVDELKKARLYTAIGPARGIVTGLFKGTANSGYGKRRPPEICDIVELTITAGRVVDEKKRLADVINRDAIKNWTRTALDNQRRLKEAERELARAQAEVARLRADVKSDMKKPRTIVRGQ